VTTYGRTPEWGYPIDHPDYWLSMLAMRDWRRGEEEFGAAVRRAFKCRRVLQQMGAL